MISRRSLLNHSLATIGTLARARTLDAKPYPMGRYVDMHTHIGQTWNSTERLTPEALLRWMDAHRIAQAIVLPLVSPEASSFHITSEFVLHETEPFRDRLIPFCAIDPRTASRGGRSGLVDMLKRYQDQGAKGLGESKPGIAFDDERNLTLFAACGEVGLPVLFHLDNQRNTDVPGLPALSRVLHQNPQTIFIGHGPGWWASISGDATQRDLAGYPKGSTAPNGAIDQLMDRYQNIYGELSAGSGANSIARDLDFGRDFLIRQQDRIMFGTDYLSPGQDVPQFDLFERQLDLPTDVEEKILRGNARRILGL